MRYHDILKGIEQNLGSEENIDFTFVEDTEVESPEMELMEYKKDFYDMSVGSLTVINAF